MKEWRNYKNRHMLYIDDQEVMTLRYDDRYGYYEVTAYLDEIKESSFEAEDLEEAKKLVEKWYARFLRVEIGELKRNISKREKLLEQMEGIKS